MRVGTRIDGKTSRKSVSRYRSTSATEEPGVHECRIHRTYHSNSRSSPAAEGAAESKHERANSRVPQPRKKSLSCSSSSRLGCHGISSRRRKLGVALYSTMDVTRSGCDAANSIARKPLSPHAKIAGRFDPTALSTRSTSSARTSSGGKAPGLSLSEQPHPRLSTMISRANDARRRRKRA